MALLRTRFAPSARDLQRLGEGMFAQAYRFRTDEGWFVIRIGVSREAFEKDQLAYERLAQTLPVPQIFAIGPFSEQSYYCISQWRSGRMLDRVHRATTLRLLPDLFAKLWSMSRVPVPADVGFGGLNGSGQPRRHYNTWGEFLGAVDEFASTFTARGSEVYKPWDALFATTAMDKALVLDARQRLQDLLPCLPDDRHYIHGDFGFDNALNDGYRLTAILDWAELGVGDWLYDLAYVAYHDKQGIDYIGAFREWLGANGLSIVNLTERMQAYYSRIFLGNVFLEANRGQWTWYREDVERYRRLVVTG